MMVDESIQFANSESVNEKVRSAARRYLKACCVYDKLTYNAGK
jgi:hypothetical protein